MKLGLFSSETSQHLTTFSWFSKKRVQNRTFLVRYLKGREDRAKAPGPGTKAREQVKSPDGTSRSTKEKDDMAVIWHFVFIAGRELHGLF